MAVFFITAALIAYDFMLSVSYHQSSSGYDSSSSSSSSSSSGNNSTNEAGKKLNKYKFKNDAVNGKPSKSKSNSLYQEK